MLTYDDCPSNHTPLRRSEKRRKGLDFSAVGAPWIVRVQAIASFLGIVWALPMKVSFQSLSTLVGPVPGTHLLHQTFSTETALPYIASRFLFPALLLLPPSNPPFFTSASQISFQKNCFETSGLSSSRLRSPCVLAPFDVLYALNTVCLLTCRETLVSGSYYDEVT